MTSWLGSPHSTSSVLELGSMGANYSAGKPIKDEVLGTSPDVIGDVWPLPPLRTLHYYESS